MKITIFSPSGVVLERTRLQLAVKRLKMLGATVTIDTDARARFQRFAGDDDIRLHAIARIAQSDADVVLAARGGYGLTRLLDRIDWTQVARIVSGGMRWVGHSDFNTFQLALLAHTGAITWAGPMALADFGCENSGLNVAPEDPSIPAGLDEVTVGCFMEAMRGELEAIGFRTEKGFDGLQASGVLWGGNLSMVCSLLATPHWPQVKNGILFLEDINERPYRVERMLLQLHQAGVLSQQKAILLGDFGQWQPSKVDRGYGLKQAVTYLRSVCDTPILTGLPFGHVQTKVMLPIGALTDLAVTGRDVLLFWGHTPYAKMPLDPRALDEDSDAQHSADGCGCGCNGVCGHVFRLRL